MSAVAWVGPRCTPPAEAQEGDYLDDFEAGMSYQLTDGRWRVVGGGGTTC